MVVQTHSHPLDLLELHCIGISEVKQVWGCGALSNNSFGWNVLVLFKRNNSLAKNKCL